MESDRRTGKGEIAFSQIEEDFAAASGCHTCPHRNIYRKFEMCLEGYAELLQNYSKGVPSVARCLRRHPEAGEERAPF